MSGCTNGCFPRKEINGQGKCLVGVEVCSRPYTLHPLTPVLSVAVRSGRAWLRRQPPTELLAYRYCLDQVHKTHGY